MPEIEADLGISHRSAGSLFFTISIGYFIALIGSGWIAAGLSHRRTIILSMGGLGLALAGTAFCNSPVYDPSDPVGGGAGGRNIPTVRYCHTHGSY